MDYPPQKKHSGDIRVNPISTSGRPYGFFNCDRERALRFPSGELLGRLP